MKKFVITALCASLTVTVLAANMPGSKAPDLAKGGKLIIQGGWRSGWVGPLGIFCGMNKPGTLIDQLLIEQIEKGSPADGILEVGDVILGADGTGASTVPQFESKEWPMIPIADAINEAEARNPALLKLLVWRPKNRPKPAATKQVAGKVPTLDEIEALGAGASKDDDEKPKDKGAPREFSAGTLETVTIKLEYLGRYSDTAPYTCEKSKNILRKGIKALYEANKPDKAGLSMLCLLAADDPTNPDTDKYQARAKEWAHQIEFGGGPWLSGPKLIALSEYYMKTKDESIFPLLVKQAEYHARGVSWFGTTGHKWADKRPDGSPQGPMTGYGPIGACGVQGLAGLSLARRAGVKSPLVEAANKAQRIFFGHYAFRGRPSYGEFFYGIGGDAAGDNNAKCAMTALALGMEENQEAKAKYFTTLSTLSPASDRTYAHGGSFFGQVWNPIGAAQGGVKAASLHFKANRWHLDLKRLWNYSRIYDGSGNDYKDYSWDATGLLFYALPLKQLYVTGRGQKESLTFSDSEFEKILAARDFAASKASNEELMAALSKTLIMGPAATELANRIKAKPEDAASAALIDQLIAVASDSKTSPGARTSACDALRKFKEKSKGALASLKNEELAKTGINMLKDPDPYIRFGAARLLENLDPEAVRPYANEIMDAIIATERPTFPLNEEDPLQAAHSVMGQLLFEKLLGKSLDGVDHKKMILAARSLLNTPNSLGRNSAAKALGKLSMDEVLELADVIIYNARYRAPANAMGGTGYMVASRGILAERQFEEGLPMGILYGTLEKEKILEKYGRAGLTLPSSDKLMEAIGEKMLSEGRIDISKVVELMQKAPAPEKMPKLKTIHAIKAAQATVTLPAAKTELVADAQNYAFPKEGDTTYTWRKVSGAGKVTFAPNATGQSKTTTASFTDQKPGRYRFEVTMSDVLGYTEVSKTVDVTLLDKNGKLPANKPPQAKSQAFTAVPGRPGFVQLSGMDPDGDDLGFIVTKQPDHGRLSGVDGRLTYTAHYGFNGTDQFTFNAVDGQGETASGTIQFKVSDKDVGVAVYEPFDGYTAQNIIGQPAKGIGLEGTWTTSRSKVVFPVKPGSLSISAFPSAGGQFIGERMQNASIGISPDVLSKCKLLENGNEMWFSVVLGKAIDIQTFSIHGDSNDVGFVINKNVTAVINFSRTTGYFPTRVNEFAERSEITMRGSMKGWNPKGPNLVVGRCIWGKTDEDKDTVEIYRVLDLPDYGPLFVSSPVSVYKDQVNQKKLNTITLGSGTVWDEIRIGPTLNSVLLGAQPLPASK
jgi:hypothetical protein